MKILLTLTLSPAFAGERGLVQSFPYDYYPLTLALSRRERGKHSAPAGSRPTAYSCLPEKAVDTERFRFVANIETT